MTANELFFPIILRFLFVVVLFLEYAGNLGDKGSSEWLNEERAHVLQLIDKF